MISERTARLRTLIAMVVCAGLAALCAIAWVQSVLSPPPGTATGQIETTNIFIFAPALYLTVASGGSTTVLGVLMFAEAFGIIFGFLVLMYIFIAYMIRVGDA
jgi:hypothetical protein